MNKNKLICLVGMPGAGKSEATEYIKEKYKLPFLRFGQIIIDEILKAGKEISLETEKEFRISVREKYGMAAMAVLNEEKIHSYLKKDNVLIDGLRSFEEYTFLKEKFDDQVVVILVFASPAIRYQRLQNRPERGLSPAESQSRDYEEIRNASIGGTIAMADYVVVNETTKEDYFTQIDQILKEIL